MAANNHKPSTSSQGFFIENQKQLPSASTNTFSWPSSSSASRNCTAQTETAFMLPKQEPKAKTGNAVTPTTGTTSNGDDVSQNIPQRVKEYTKAMNWMFPLSEKQLEALTQTGLAMDDASKEMQQTAEMSSETASRLATTLAESHEVYRFINDQWLAVNGAPHAVSMYNIACLLSLLVELELRLLEKGDDLLAAVQKHQQDSVIVLSDMSTNDGFQKIGSTEPTVGHMVHKQLRSCRACLGAAVAAGWSDMKHLRTDRDLKALRELLP